MSECFSGPISGIKRLPFRPSRSSKPVSSSADVFRRKNSQSLLGPGDAEMARRGSASLLDGGGIRITYCTAWASPNLHYRKDEESAWTDAPGVPFTKAGEERWYTSLVANSLEFVCNDGSNQWDKPAHGGNYKIDIPGRYIVKNGMVKRMVPPPRPPRLVVVTSIEPSQIELSWNPPDVEDGVAGYVIYQLAIGSETDIIHRHGSLDGSLSPDSTCFPSPDSNGYCNGYSNGYANSYANGVHLPNGNLTEHEEDKGESVSKTNATERFCVVGGLKGKTTYKFSVATVNEDGLESACAETEVTTSVPGKPSAPTFLQAVSHDVDHIALSWAPPLSKGGASVTAYHIFRDGVAVHTVVSRDPETGDDLKELGWRDSNVQQGKEYRYSVSAMHLPDRTPSKAALLELLEKRASRSLLEVPDEENEGPACEEIAVKAVASIMTPRLGERKTHVILQGFNWNSNANKTGWYNVLLSKVEDVRRAGFDMMWLPPPAQSVDKAGYLPSKWYDLTSHYGTHQELVALGRALSSEGIALMMDFVVNHRCASKQDNRGRWTIFEQPEWGAWAICSNDNSGAGEGAQSTGEMLEYAPDIDHTNPRVQEDVKKWVAWIFKEVGFCCLRLDFVIGFAPHFQEQYVRAAGSPFAVAEYWHGDPSVLRNYVNATKGMVAVFDFPVYYTLKGCIHSKDFGGLSWDGKAPGILGSDAVRSCTFIENHDTDHLEVVGGCFGNNVQVIQGYAYILTHPGTPTVYWTDWSDRGDNARREIERLVQIRFRQGLHCLSKLSIAASEGGLYAAYIDGNQGSVAMKLGDRDWHPHGSQWKVAAYGHEYCIWVNK